MVYYKTKEFRKLQREWYAKLKDDGFEDQEFLQDDGDMGDLPKAGVVTTASIMHRFGKGKKKKTAPGQTQESVLSVVGRAVEEHQIYYGLARAHYWNLPEDTPEDLKEGYRRWSEGDTFREIGRALHPEKTNWRKKLAAFCKAQEMVFLNKAG